jgi:hypothetical protein
MVAKMERGALSTTLLVLFALFLAQFFVGNGTKPAVNFPTNHFPAGGGSFTDALSYALTDDHNSGRCGKPGAHCPQTQPIHNPVVDQLYFRAFCFR